MALTATYDTRLNKNYELNSAISRGVGMAFGTLAVTYSGAGGLSWVLPFSKTVFVSVQPASGYIFEYNATSSMLKAYMVNSSTLPLTEVASDTDFTNLSCPLQWVAFGF